MSPWAMSAVFAGGFATALAGTVPMSLALSWLGADGAGVSAAEISGSIWNGRLKAAHYRGIPLGDVETSLDPLALVGGTRRLAVQGPIGRATLVAGEERGFETADAVLEIEHLHLTPPLTGRLTLENATLLFSSERCARAEGRIAANILERAKAPEIVGSLSCAGEAAIARLEGQSEGVQVSMVVRLDAGGRYQAETHVVSGNPLLRAALEAAGFSPRGDGLVRSDEGDLKI